MSLEPSMRDYSIDPVLGTILAMPVVAGLLALVLIPHWLLWKEMAFLDAFTSLSLRVLLLGFVLMIVLHEAIHGLTWMMVGDLTLRQIKFGVIWKALAPYAHPKVPLSARAYRLGVLMPGLLLGLLPAIVGVALGDSFLAGWGALLLSFAGGDLLVLLAIYSVPAEALILDHPSRFGCLVVEGQAGSQ